MVFPVYCSRCLTHNRTQNSSLFSGCTLAGQHVAGPNALGVCGMQQRGSYLLQWGRIWSSQQTIHHIKTVLGENSPQPYIISCRQDKAWTVNLAYRAESLG